MHNSEATEYTTQTYLNLVYRILTKLIAHVAEKSLQRSQSLFIVSDVADNVDDAT